MNIVLLSKFLNEQIFNNVIAVDHPRLHRKLRKNVVDETHLCSLSTVGSHDSDTSLPMKDKDRTKRLS